MTDLPDFRPFTWMLIGLWWPAPPTQPAAAVGFWSGHKEAKQREAEDINNATEISENAPKWLAAHGFDIEEPQPPSPITGDRLR